MKRVVRGNIHWWAVLMLPIFLRALIPVGFMPVVAPDGALRIVVCDAYAPVPHAMSMMMSMHAGMSTDGHMGAHGGMPGHGGHDDHGGCPFGSAPTLGGVPTLAVLPPFWMRLLPAPAVRAPQVANFEVSPRAQSPRGPPV